MAATGVLNAEKRSASGSNEARRLRRSGRIPVMLKTLDGTAMQLQVSEHELFMMLSRHASENLVLDINCEGVVRKALLKEVQHDPVTRSVLHLDLSEVSMTETMQATVGVVLTGEPIGVTQGGGVPELLVRELEVECLPGDMVEEIELDVSALGIGEMLTVADLKAPAGIVVLTAQDIAVALVSAPRTEEEPAAGAAAEGAEPELASKKGKEQEDKDAADKKGGKG